MPLTTDEKHFLHAAEKLTAKVWRIVAKDQGCTPDEYENVHYGQRLQDFQTALERNPI